MKEMFINHPRCYTCEHREECGYCVKLSCDMEDDEYCCLHSELKE